MADVIARSHEHIELNTHAERVNAAAALLDELLHLRRDHELAVGDAALGPDQQQLTVELRVRRILAPVRDQVRQVANDRGPVGVLCVYRWKCKCVNERVSRGSKYPRVH